MKPFATRLVFAISALIWLSRAQAQNHFNPVAPSIDSYSLVVSAAAIDGAGLEANDEIGVFTSAGLCVGAIKLASPPFVNMPFAAWKNNPQTPSVDGYTPGDTMRFKIWDNSAQRELTGTPTYQLGNGTFENGLYALLSLSATANRPPSIPLLIAPLWGQTAASLKWSKSIDPDAGDVVNYQVQIAPDSSFSTGTIAPTAATEELAISTIGSQLMVGKIYYWRVQARDQKNASAGFSRKWAFKYEGNNVVTEVGERQPVGLPLAFALHQSYPNPVRQTTNAQAMIRFDLPQAERVTLQIFNLLGQRVRELIDAEKSPGFHRVVWNGRDDHGKPVPIGVYFYRVQAGKMNGVKKLVVAR
jgi:hypothetical protein